MKKRILSVLLAALMLLSALPLGMVDTAYAATTLASGKCGDSATWKLDSTGTLTISGTGATYDYDMDDNGNSAAPWCTTARIQRVKKVVVNSGITELGYSMFSNCTQLTTVTLPSGLKRIGSCLFLGCTKLSAITIPSSVTTIESNAFTHCDSITTITLPSGLRTMGDAVCSQMASLTTATVSSGVTYLSNYAFNNCPKLKSITLPNTVKSIGSYAFRYDTALKDVYFNGSVAQWTSIQVASAGNSALYNADVHCSGLPAPTVTGSSDAQGRPVLKWKAVSGASKYEVYRAYSKTGTYTKYSTVTGTTYTNTSYLTDGTTYYYKVRALDTDGYAGAYSTPVSVTYTSKSQLPAPTVTGGSDAQGRPTLKWNAVSGASKYEVYRSYSQNGTYTKYSTTTGTSYTNSSYLTDGTTYYYKVRALDANGAAGPYSSVVSVTYTAPASTVASGACGDSATWKLDSAGTLTISGTGATYDFVDDDYNYTAPWYDAELRLQIKKVVVNKGITYVGTCAFRDCAELTSVSLPAGLEEMGNSVFSYCESLTSITIPDGVTGIGGDFFRNCTSLKSVTLPDSLYRVGGCTFMDCTSLTSVRLPADLYAITWHMFKGCTSLTSVTIPRGTVEVMKEAFDGCKALKNVTFTGSSADWSGVTIRSGNTALTNATLKCTGSTVLPAPTLSISVSSQGQPTLKWNSISGAEIYQLWYSYDDGENYGPEYYNYGNNGKTPTSLTINTEDLEKGQTYTFKVRAVTSGGATGSFSKEVTFTYNPTASLAAPTVTGGNDSQGRPTLTWKAVSGASKYEVYRARSLNGDYIKYSTVTGTSYTNTSYIENSATYYYKVRALKADGTAGPYSSVVSVTYKQTLPAPTVTGGHDSQGRPTLKWNAVSGAAKYEVYRSYSQNGTYTKYSTTTGTAYTNSAYLTDGTTYYYKVRALDASGTAGAYSAVVSVTYKQTLPAPAVTGGNDAQGRPTLTWNAVSGAAKYEVYRARSRSGDYIKYSTVTGTSYTNTSYIENGGTYYYKVRALDANGTAGAWSTVVSVTCTMLSAPSVTGGSDAQGRPTLTWKAVTGAAKYEVYRSYSQNGTYTKYSTVVGTSYTNTAYLTDGTTYYYKVRALKSDGAAGAWSAVVSVTYTKILPAPSVTGGNDDQGYPVLTWDAVPDAAQYEVCRADSADGAFTKLDAVTLTGYTDSAVLTDGAAYYYKVRALKSDGMPGIFSDVVSVTYIAKPAVVDSGTCGDSASWTLDAEGVLTISGTGPMADYGQSTADSGAPWYRTYANDIKTVVVEEGVTTIGSCAFARLEHVTSVTIPQGVTSIGNGAFENCGLYAYGGLGAVTLPEGLTTIGSSAFSGSYMDSLTLPESLRTIGSTAFERSHLKTMTIPRGVTSIGNGAFRNAHLTSIQLPDGAQLGDFLFYQCYELTDVTLPADLTVIGDSMFENCSKLTHVTIPSGVTRIEREAFAMCGTLEEIRLPEGVETIGVIAFSGCVAMTSAYLPRSLTTIESGAFSACRSLTDVYYDGTAEEWAAISVAETNDPLLTAELHCIPTTVASGTCGDSAAWTLDSEGTLTISGTGATYDFFDDYNYTAPWYDAEMRLRIRKVVVEKGITYVGTCAFQDCTDLTSVSLPAGLETMGNSVFCSCESLTSVIIPSGVWKLGGDFFSGCTSLKSVTLPNSLYSVGGCTFMDCTSLTSVRLPVNFKSITWRMFQGCTSLTSVTIPRGTVEVMTDAFDGCTALQNVTFTGSSADWNGVTIRSGNTALTNAARTCTGSTVLTAPTLSLSVSSEGQPTLEWNAVSGAAGYQIWYGYDDGEDYGPEYYNYGSNGKTPTSLTIKTDALQKGRTYTFKVRAVTSGGSLGSFSKEVTFTYDPVALVASGTCGDSAAWTLDADGTLTITGTGPMADYGAYGPWYVAHLTDIKTVVVEEGVTTIGSYAFAKLSYVTSVTIPSGITSIGAHAFENCRLGGAVTLLEGLTAIGDSAFSGSGMASLTLPESLRTIGSSAFSYCSLRELTIPDGVTSIGTNAFYNASLTSVKLPDSGVTLGDSLFQECENLTDVTLPADLTAIGPSMFENCGSLKNVTIPSGVTRIEREAFAMCGALEEIRLPEGVETIGVIAFSGCVAMTSAYLPHSLTTIEKGAFSACRSLTDVYYDGTAEEWAAISVAETNDPLLTAELHCTPAAVVSGTCGDSATWTLDADGVLTITGTGVVNDYPMDDSENNTAPWSAHTADIKTVVVDSGITELGYALFANCTHLTSVTLPDGLTRIGSCLFIGCTALEGVDIPSSVTAIESNAFTGCDSITDITLPGGLAAMGDAVCSQMASLTTATVSDGVTYLSSYAFNSCPKLTSITLPGTVKSIKSCAFRYDTALTDVYYGGTAAQWTAIQIDSRENSALLNAALHCTGQSAAPLDAPAMTLGEDASDGKPTIWWPAVTGAERYEIWRAQAMSDGSAPAASAYTMIVSADVTFHKDTTAEADTWYYYKVRAVSGSTYSDFSPAARQYCEAPPTMDTPEIQSLELDDSGKPVLTWRTVEGATRYQVFRSEDDGFSYTPMGTVLPTGSDTITWTDATAVSGTGYYYGVGCYDDDGHYSSFDGDWGITAR